MAHTQIFSDEIVVTTPGDNDLRTSVVIKKDGQVIAHIFVGQFSTSISKGIFSEGLELESKEVTV
tara:strand:+ start:613 stop:807 length:195 start_codon:yes stop_codon:yes gene_type:complete